MTVILTSEALYLEELNVEAQMSAFQGFGFSPAGHSRPVLSLNKPNVFRFFNVSSSAAVQYIPSTGRPLEIQLKCVQSKTLQTAAHN